MRAAGGAVDVQQRRRLEFRDVTELLVVVNIGTSAKDRDPVKECGGYRVPKADWETLLKAHRAEHPHPGSYHSMIHAHPDSFLFSPCILLWYDPERP